MRKSRLSRFFSNPLTKLLAAFIIVAIAFGGLSLAAPSTNSPNANPSSLVTVQAATKKTLSKQAKIDYKKVKKALNETTFVLTHETKPKKGSYGLFAEQSQYSLDITCKPQKGKLVYEVVLMNAYTGDKVETLKNVNRKKVTNYLQTVDEEYF